MKSKMPRRTAALVTTMALCAVLLVTGVTAAPSGAAEPAIHLLPPELGESITQASAVEPDVRVESKSGGTSGGWSRS